MMIETLPTTDLEGKYLSFGLGQEIYGLRIHKVQEIIGVLPATRVPHTPHFIRGVINLRGKVIPIVDLRNKFGLEEIEDTERTCIVIVQIKHHDHLVVMGAVVDDVCEVFDISKNQIEPAPSFGTTVDTSFIMALAKAEEQVIILVDIDLILAQDQLAMVLSD